MLTMISKIGSNKGAPKSRVWLEGTNVSAVAGFVKGASYQRCWTNTGLDLVLVRDHAIPSLGRVYTVSGKGASHSVIDTTGKKITAKFGDLDTVLVTFQRGVISIERNV